jgi:methyl-accepting chemotaxis protein
MFSLQSFSIRARFYIVLATVSCSLLALGVWGWASGVSANQKVAQIFDTSNAGAIDVANLREAMSHVRRWEVQAMAVGATNANEVQRLMEVWKAEIQSVKSLGEKIVHANADDAEIARLVANQGKLMNEYRAVIEPLLTQLQGALIEGPVAMAYAAGADDTIAALKTNTAELLAAQQAGVSRARERMAADATAASLLRFGLVALTLALFVPLMWLTLQSVCRPLDRAVEVARRIATGDLSQDIVVHGHDETAHLLRALDAMQTSLSQVVGEVRDSAESIKAASAEVAHGNQDLSQRTEQAASNLQRTASSMSDLTDTVQQSALSAQQANQLAASAAEVAALGGEVVSQVVSTMEEINHSSMKISDIISVIDGIAFQTNILALNAAVEAARAGEQGRGFSVVAGEVRSLASRCAEAAKEIKDLIDTSVDRVETGSRLVSQAGKTMQDIVLSVQRVSDIIGHITAASSEQSEGIGQVNDAVGELDQMTQQNAALVEQSAAAAQSLHDQSEKLSRVVATFQLGSSMTAA